VHRKGGDDDQPGQMKRNKFKMKKGSERKRPEEIVKARKIKAKKQAFTKSREIRHDKNRSHNKS